jgi:hypothetical protein
MEKGNSFMEQNAWAPPGALSPHHRGKDPDKLAELAAERDSVLEAREEKLRNRAKVQQS